MKNESSLNAYRKWVIAAGIYNLVFGLPLTIPVLYKKYYASNNNFNKMLHLGGEEGVTPDEGINKLFVNIAGLMLCVTGLNMLYAAMDLRNRMGIPVFNILGRVIAFGLIWYYTTKENITRIMALFSIVDITFAGAFIYYTSILRGRSLRNWLR